jgi:hypothetical protein
MEWKTATPSTPLCSSFVIDRIPDDSIPVERKARLVKKYQSLVGGLLWLRSRPDISTAVSLLSCYSHNPSTGHYEATKRVLAYLQGTLGGGIRFTQGGPPVLVNVLFPTTDGTYTDANWGPQDASHPTTNEATVTIAEVQPLLGHVVFRMGGPVCWGCTREKGTVSCKSEIYATDEGTKSAMTVRNLLYHFGFQDGINPSPVWNGN